MLKSRLLSSVRPFYAAEKGEGTEEIEEKVEGEPTDEEVEEKEEEREEVEAKGEKEVEEGTEETAEEKKPEIWQDKELRRKHAKLQDSEREKAELRAELEATKKLLERTGGKKTGETTEEAVERTGLTQEDVKKEAAAIVAKDNYDRACDEAATKGQKEYAKTWMPAMENLKNLGGFDRGVMDEILATDDAAKVLHHLGSNPDEYHRIIDLPPARRLAEMVKIALPTVKKPTGVSRAAAPVNSLRSRAPTDTALRDDLTDEQWATRRRAQRKERFEQRNGTRA